MLYSILITTWECHGAGINFIKHNLSSVISQTYRPLQCVISDHSKDDEIETYVKSIDTNGVDMVYTRYTEKHGFCGANWNNALEFANGDFIQYHTMDDWFHDPTAVERVVKKFNENESSKWMIVSKYQHPSMVIQKPVWAGIMSPTVNTVGGPNSVIIRSSIKTIKMDDRLIWYVDTDWYHRLGKEAGTPCIYTDEEPVYTCRNHPLQLQNELAGRLDIINYETEIIKNKYKEA